MALSYADTTATAGQTVVAVPFPYLSQADVHVTVNEANIADGDLTWTSSNEVTLPNALSAGDAVHIYRSTPADDLIYQAQPGPIDHRQVNRALLQLLYIVQEAYDSAIQARDIADELLTILDEVTALYNQIQDWYNTIEDIFGDGFFLDFTGTVPYPPSIEEKLLEWLVPMNCQFDDTCALSFAGRMFGPVSVDLTMTASKVTFDDTDPDNPTETVVDIGTFSVDALTTKITFARAGSGAVSFTKNVDYLRISMGDGTSSNIEGFSLNARLRRV